MVVKALVELFFLVFPLSHHSPFFSKINKNKEKKYWNDLQVVIDVKSFIWKDTSRSRLGQSCYGYQFQNSLIFSWLNISLMIQLHDATCSTHQHICIYIKSEHCNIYSPCSFLKVFRLLSFSLSRLFKNSTKIPIGFTREVFLKA